MDSKSLWSDQYSPNDPTPSYEESVQQRNPKPTESAKNQTVAERLAQVQRTRIESLIENSIDPLLNKHTESGLFKAAFAFLFSDISLLQQGCDNDGTGDSLLKFPHDEYTCVLRLEGDENSSRFWQQPSVTRDLERELKKKLGIDMEEPPAKQTEVQSSSASTETFRNTSKIRSFWGKYSQSRAAEPVVIPKFTQAESGWRADDPFSSDTSRTRLRVNCEDVYVRVQTDIGLYQTRNCPALVVRFHIGH